MGKTFGEFGGNFHFHFFLEGSFGLTGSGFAKKKESSKAPKDCTQPASEIRSGEKVRKFFSILFTRKRKGKNRTFSGILDDVLDWISGRFENQFPSSFCVEPNPHPEIQQEKKLKN